MKSKKIIRLEDGIELREHLMETLQSETATNEPLQTCIASISVCEVFLNTLKEQVIDTGFSSTAQEIVFFKEIKPFITGQLYFNWEKYQLMLRRPAGGRNMQEKFLQEESIHIQHFLSTHSTLYQYHRLKASYLDKEFFLREAVLTHRDLQFPPIEDRLYSTGYDMLFGRIICNELLMGYLQDQIELLEPTLQKGPNKKLVWQGAKTAVVEMAYALRKMGVFGSASLQDIVDNLEWSWNINLGNYSRTHQQTKFRKAGVDSFLEDLARHYRNSLDI